jgi:histidinol-phosphate aminotransferase
MLEPVTSVQSLKQYQPPLGDRAGLRLDFNENTIGCSPRVLARMRSLTAEDLSRYPEREPAERLVAGWLGVEPSQVLLTNGVDEGIHLLAETYLGPMTEALIPVPTFSLYQIYAAATGACVTTVESNEDFSLPLASLLHRITPATRLIAIANPNSPTGSVTAPKNLMALAEAAPNAAVLIDEAYFDFYGQTVLGAIEQLPNLFVARTFSKAFGMAGLRVGALIGNARQMSFVKRAASPYNVNAVALACLAEAIRDTEYVRAYVDQVRRNRERLEVEFQNLELPFWKSEGNFILVRLGAARLSFISRMRQRGILIRDRDADPGCAGCVRITVGTDEQTSLLINALHSALGEIKMAAGMPA